jgi:hypothetical protein
VRGADACWLRQVLLALHFVHANNILHRDLKPSNVLATKPASSTNNGPSMPASPQGAAHSSSNLGRVCCPAAPTTPRNLILKLADFGVARGIDTDGSIAGSTVGTPHFISPEMIDGRRYGRKSDVWALGCLLYELATTRKPFEASNVGGRCVVLCCDSFARGDGRACTWPAQRCSQPVDTNYAARIHPGIYRKIAAAEFAPLPASFSAGLHQLVGALLAKDPQDRPSTGEVLDMPYVRQHLASYLEYARGVPEAQPEVLLATLGQRPSGGGSTAVEDAPAPPPAPAAACMPVATAPPAAAGAGISSGGSVSRSSCSTATGSLKLTPFHAAAAGAAGADLLACMSRLHIITDAGSAAGAPEPPAAPLGPSLLRKKLHGRHHTAAAAGSSYSLEHWTSSQRGGSGELISAFRGSALEHGSSSLARASSSLGLLDASCGSPPSSTASSHGGGSPCRSALGHHMHSRRNDEAAARAGPAPSPLNAALGSAAADRRATTGSDVGAGAVIVPQPWLEAGVEEASAAAAPHSASNAASLAEGIVAAAAAAPAPAPSKAEGWLQQLLQQLQAAGVAKPPPQQVAAACMPASGNGYRDDAAILALPQQPTETHDDMAPTSLMGWMPGDASLAQVQQVQVQVHVQQEQQQPAMLPAPASATAAGAEAGTSSTPAAPDATGAAAYDDGRLDLAAMVKQCLSGNSFLFKRGGAGASSSQLPSGCVTRAASTMSACGARHVHAVAPVAAALPQAPGSAGVGDDDDDDGGDDDGGDDDDDEGHEDDDVAGGRCSSRDGGVCMAPAGAPVDAVKQEQLAALQSIQAFKARFQHHLRGTHRPVW